MLKHYGQYTKELDKENCFSLLVDKTDFFNVSYRSKFDIGTNNHVKYAIFYESKHYAEIISEEPHADIDKIIMNFKCFQGDSFNYNDWFKLEWQNKFFIEYSFRGLLKKYNILNK